MPVSVTFCVRSASTTCSVALNELMLSGVNVRDTMQVLPAPSDVPQAFERIAKSAVSPAVRPMLVMASAEPPEFVSITLIGALGVFTACGVKGTERVDNVSVGGARPVPLRPMVCVPFEALLAICSVALRIPVPWGSKVTMIVQVLFGVTAAAHPEAAKSPGFAPINVKPVTIRFDPPVFVMVTPCAGLIVFWPCGANTRPSVGSMITGGGGGGGAWPVPRRVMTQGLLPPAQMELLVIVRVADSAAVVDGINEIRIWQEVPPGSPGPPGGLVTVGGLQLSVSGKSVGFAPEKEVAIEFVTSGPLPSS